MNVLNNVYMQIGVFVAIIGAFFSLFAGWWFFARRHGLVALVVALVAAVVGLVVLFEFILPRRYPEFDPNLPIFLSHVWTWMLFFSLLAIVALGTLVWVVGGRSRVSSGPGEGRHPDLDAAWQSILMRLGQANIHPASQQWFLILGPDDAAVDRLIRAAGVPLFAVVPEEQAPIRAYAGAEGIFLGCAGACGIAVRSAEGTERLADVAGKLSALNPDCPPVRGLILLLPADWINQADAPKWASWAREDLQTVRSILRLRLPVFALISKVEALTGLHEFIRRIPEAMRNGRCGFAVPTTITFSGDLVQRGLGWLAGWFDTWCLSLMSGDVLDTASNGRLYLLTSEVRRTRRRWRAALEAALSTHHDAEPVLLRGVYLASTGEVPDEHAFAAGLLRGPRSRVLADQALVDWSEVAHHADRYYLRWALAIGLAVGLLALMTWLFIATRHPLGWVGLLVLIVTWVVVFIRLAVRMRG